MLGYKKGNTKLLTGQIPLHYPGDRVYLDGDPTKTVQDKVARKADLTNLDLTGTTNTTGSTIATGTYFYLNGTLVRAKTAIASGATFTLNTNYEVKTVGGAIDELAGKDLIRATYSTTTDSVSMATITVSPSYKIIGVFSKRTYYIERYCINESNDYTVYVKLSDYNGTALNSGTNVDFVIYCIKA